MKIFLYTDGGARGNPGPGAIGAVLKDEFKKILKKEGKYLGNSTNNEAEYIALIVGMELSLENNATELECFLDSELVVRQLNGNYKVKSEKLRIYFDRVKDLEEKFNTVSYKHIPREKNKEADALVNQILDSKK